MDNKLPSQTEKSSKLHDGLQQEKNTVKEFVAYLIGIDDDGEIEEGDFTKVVFSEADYKDLLECKRTRNEDCYFPIYDKGEQIDVPVSSFHLVN